MASSTTVAPALRHYGLRYRYFDHSLHSRARKKSVRVAMEQTNGTADSPLRLTYLEGNSWLWEVKGTRILVDPVLVGNLDFGVPWLYDGAKKHLKNFQLSDLKEIDCVLITQSLDDHCHVKTIRPLSELFPNIRVISTPNAEPILNSFFNQIVYIGPGQDTELMGKDGQIVKIHASAGPVLGPPWQRPENGYFINSEDPIFTLYYEPHCVYAKDILKGKQADVVITPVIKQLLPAFTLVSGQEDALELTRLLNARFVVPMNNGDLESKGALSSLLRSQGTVESFKDMLSKSLPNVRVLEPTPGVALEVPLNVQSLKFM